MNYRKILFILCNLISLHITLRFFIDLLHAHNDLMVLFPYIMSKMREDVENSGIKLTAFQRERLRQSTRDFLTEWKEFLYGKTVYDDYFKGNDFQLLCFIFANVWATMTYNFDMKHGNLYARLYDTLVGGISRLKGRKYLYLVPYFIKYNITRSILTYCLNVCDLTILVIIIIIIKDLIMLNKIKSKTITKK